MNAISRKATAIAGVAILGAGLLGSAALASTPSADATARAAIEPLSGVTLEAENERNRGDKLRRVLDGLVEKGVITAEQAEAIMEAVARAHEKRDGDRRSRFAWNAVHAAVEYIGLPAEAVRGQLGAGKTLGEIADQQPGKSRDGLIAYLRPKAEDAIAKALADGKITPEQAAELRTRVDAMIVKLVDRTWDGVRPASTTKTT